MNEEQAETMAQILRADAWNSGGDIWLVVCRRGDGRLVVISDEAVCEYPDQTAFDEARPDTTIVLH